MNTKCPGEVSFVGQPGSFEVVLEMPFYHQLHGADHPVCHSYRD